MIGLLRSNLFWLAAYLLAMSAVVWLVFRAHHTLVPLYSTPQAQEDWEAWRAEAARQQTSGPVWRRVPKSDRPPALRLLEEHFGVCLTMCLVLGSALFVTLMMMFRGVATRPSPVFERGHRRDGSR